MPAMKVASWNQRSPNGNSWIDQDHDADVHLPGDCLLRTRRQANGRLVVEIYDATDLIGLVASTSLEIISIDGAWRGLAIGPDGNRLCWALAIGHTIGPSLPSVTFARRLRQGRQHRLAVAPLVVDGIWVAMATGLHTTVSLRQASRHRVRRLATATRQGRATAASPRSAMVQRLSSNASEAAATT